MKSYKETTPRFLLKDQLFHKKNVTDLATRIQIAYPKFKKRAFINRVVKKFPELELKERIVWITHNLDHYIPESYQNTVKILLASLPDELDSEQTDDDFGEFINAPCAHYVATKGLEYENRKYLAFSLQALREITKRFSAEDAIRYFINAHPDETFTFLETCMRDKNYHVRRLASEGTRASLPWCQNITTDYKRPMKILDTLHADKTRYVTRSVANHMNDLSKIDPMFVIQTLKRWKKEHKQKTEELDFIAKHSLRTLVKQGNKEALKLLGYKKPAISIESFNPGNKKINIGDNYDFSFTVCSEAKKSQLLLINYIMYFLKKDGSSSTKTFKITRSELESDKCLEFNKIHRMKSMSTKTLYPGEHKIELQINGEKYKTATFTLL